MTTDSLTAGLSGARDDPARTGRWIPGQAVPALTILLHPDLRRVGERAVLSELALGQEAAVSRLGPEFRSPGVPTGQPLRDGHLSRKPFFLAPGEPGGLTLRRAESRTEVRVQGAPAGPERPISAAEIAAGTVLELSQRVVLLLHRVAGAPPGAPPPRYGLIGDSPALERLRWDIHRVADLEVPVLLRGETGTGKELVARAIHEAGPRRHGPFVSVNLGALPPALAAAELFGAEKGSFTGAVRSQPGYFRAAQGGTLFLDEIGEAPPEIQVALLRVLETGEVNPVGLQSRHRVDARVVAATDADLERRAREGTFREPLLYRLAGYEVWLPPLRERRDDVGRLFFAFLREELERVGEAWRLADADPPWVPPSVMARLAGFDWPGNVRQLRNVTRQLVIGSRGLARLEISPKLDQALDPAPLPEQPEPEPPAGRPARRKPSEVAPDELLAALRACRWDLQAAADRLRISRPSLYLLIESSPGVRKAGDLGADEIAACHAECAGDVEAMVDRLEVSRKALLRRLRELGLAPEG